MAILQGDNNGKNLPKIPKQLAVDFQILLRNSVNSKTLNLFEKLEAIYAYLDKYNKFVSTFAVCKKGCSYCCKHDVSVSRLEAEYITHKGGPTLNPKGEVTIGHAVACPFLAGDNSCSIYEIRPFNCRTLHTLDDPKYCAEGNEEHQLYGSSAKGYGANFYSSLAGWLKDIHQSQGLSYRDIRDWFPAESPQTEKSWLSRFIQKMWRQPVDS